MRLGWATDIHLDFVSNSAEFDQFCKSMADGNDAAVITGDISSSDSTIGLIGELQSIAGIPIYFVLGNHDYYGSDVKTVRSAARDASTGPAKYLPTVGPVRLQNGTWLVGVDGWADAQEGDYEKSPVRLNDSVFIKDMRDQILLSKKHQGRYMEKMGKIEAETLSGFLRTVVAKKETRKVIVATHVPPYRGSTWHEGSISNSDFLPFFCCRAVGNTISDFAVGNPGIQFTILCGHTHGSGEYRPHPNVLVLTGEAEYRHPRAQVPINL